MKKMIRTLCLLSVLLFNAGCGKQAAKHPLTCNQIERIETKPLGQQGVELTITQQINPDAPAYITNLRESKWANRLRWSLVKQTLGKTTVVSTFHIHPVGQPEDLSLTRDDFEWYPPLSGFQPIPLSFKNDPGLPKPQNPRNLPIP